MNAQPSMWKGLLLPESKMSKDTEEIYSPNQGICCKPLPQFQALKSKGIGVCLSLPVSCHAHNARFKSRKCGHIFSFSKFDAKAPDQSR